jgi:putative endonuclease
MASYTQALPPLSRIGCEHRSGLVHGFTVRYRLRWLVYYEQYDEILAAIQREKNIKHWFRAWKVQLIEQMNPQWSDLYLTLNA